MSTYRDGRLGRRTDVERRARSSKEMWNAAAVKGVRGRPWDPSGTMTHERLQEADPFRIPEVPRVAAAEEEEARTPVPRGFEITEPTLRKLGQTAGCPKCDAIGRRVESMRTHSQACRRRITELVEEDEEYKGRRDGAEERANRYCEEKNDEDKKEADAQEEEEEGEEEVVSPEETSKDDTEMPTPKCARTEEKDEEKGRGTSKEKEAAAAVAAKVETRRKG